MKLAIDCYDLICKGVAVGCGWQSFVAYVNVGSYYVVGVPLGALLGFYFNFGAKVLQHSVLVGLICIRKLG